ncbi:hypothetical protein F5Y16DRAFT_416075 [Xylariaceae sp. FL0255]|nr:hypothetical protein F5Y16DRAFT_416075 [Xylariaceae sp. FL0255]
MASTSKSAAGPSNQNVFQRDKGSDKTHIGIVKLCGADNGALMEQLSRKLGTENFGFSTYKPAHGTTAKISGDTIQTGANEVKGKGKEWAENRPHNTRDKENYSRASVHMWDCAAFDDVHAVLLDEQHPSFIHIIYLGALTQTFGYENDDDFSKVFRWHNFEKMKIWKVCIKNDVLFYDVSGHTSILEKLAILIDDFGIHNEAHNTACVLIRLDEIMLGYSREMHDMLFISADWALSSGYCYYQELGIADLESLRRHSMQTCLEQKRSKDGISFEAYFEAAAQKVTVRPEFLNLLQKVAEQKCLGAMVVSRFFGQVWQNVLVREGLSDTVPILGGGLAAGHVLTAEMLRAIVHSLGFHYNLRIKAFMQFFSPWETVFPLANQSFLVVDSEWTHERDLIVGKRRRLIEAIGKGLRGSQILFPPHTKPLLDDPWYPSTAEDIIPVAVNEGVTEDDVPAVIEDDVCDISKTDSSET